MAIFRPIAALVCDDIRTEINRKEIFIGVYTNELVVYRLPVALSLRIHLIGELSEAPGPIAFEVRVEVPGKRQNTVVKAEIEVIEGTNPHEHVGLSLPAMLINVEQAGGLLIEYRQDQDPWQPIKVLPIIHQARPIDAPSGPTPPS